MIIKVDPASALPVYDQIREQITVMASSGVLAVGSRLPTIRQLAGDLQVARGTIAKAYALLEQTGVVESRGHKGTFILDPPLRSDAEKALTEAAAEYCSIARQLGTDQERALLQIKEQWIVEEGGASW